MVNFNKNINQKQIKGYSNCISNGSNINLKKPTKWITKKNMT